MMWDDVAARGRRGGRGGRRRRGSDAGTGHGAEDTEGKGRVNGDMDTPKVRASEGTAVTRAETGPTSAPISLTQQSSLLMAPHNPSREYMSWVYQLNGKLDAGALAQAVDDVVAAHDILRVRFVRHREGPMQLVTPFRPGVLRVVRLDDRPKLEGLTAAITAVEAEYRDLSPWDEARLHATLYVVAPKTHVLAIFVAEALVDGESGTLVAAELSRAYAKHAGRVPPELPVPNDASYLRWVADHPVPESVQARAVEHWRRLGNVPVAAGRWPTTLGATGARPITRFFNVPPAQWQHLVDSTPGMAAMPFVVVLSWLEMALARVSGADRFLVTSAVSNRSRPETKAMIGNFVGPVRLAADVGVGDRLEDVSPRVLASLRLALAASVVPVPLAHARLLGEDAFVPPEPTVSFYMFSEREGPDLAGVRQRRFRVNTGRDVLRVNCTPDDVGGRNFFVISGSAAPQLLDALAVELKGFLQVV
ncbi:MAG: condensation domain-containing protein [Acidimicrobiales bacterium]